MNGQNSGPNWSLILGIVSLAVSATTGAILFGEIKGKVKDNTEDIAELRNDRRGDAEKLGQIQLDVREIKTTLRVLVPSEPQESHR